MAEIWDGVRPPHYETRKEILLEELPQHASEERCTRECLDAFLKACEIEVLPWQRLMLYDLLCEHPGAHAAGS